MPYCAGARFYSADLGRFLSPDPVESMNYGSPQSLNPYSYVLNNPLTLADPTGACVADDAGGCIPWEQLGGPPKFRPQSTCQGLNCPAVPIVTLQELVGGEFSAWYKAAIVSAGLCSLYCRDVGNTIGDSLGTLFSSDDDFEQEIAEEVADKALEEILVASPGSSPDAVEIKSDDPEAMADAVFGELIEGATEVTVPSYAGGGKMYVRPDGIRVGLRTDSKGNRTIDVHGKAGGTWKKIKFK